MKSLFIDTSTKDVSIATLEDNKIISLVQKDIKNEHSIYAIPYIDEVLKNSKIKKDEVEKIYVINGPGSFTGIRIGLTIAKVYSYITNINVVCISSLKAIALSNEKGKIISLIDAKNNNYYLGIYDYDFNDEIKEQFININDLKKILEKYKDYKITSCDDIIIENKTIKKIKLNIENIVSYYQNKKGHSSFKISPNYIKLPSALEAKKWLKKKR